jgi:spore germination protein GerM
VLDLRVEGGTAAIELDDAGLRRVHGRPYSELVFWSIVYTMTEVPGVERVSLLRGGVPLPALGDPPFSVPAVAGRQDAPAWVRPREL